MKFKGILPAIVTPNDHSGNFCESCFATHIRALYTAGVHGLYVLGQTGEGNQQPTARRMAVLESAVRCSPPGKQLIVHVGANTTAEAIALAVHAGQAGAHAISSLPPLGAYSFSEIRRYYEALADASPLPLFLYHHPDSCPEITPDRALDLCSIPNVAGFKFTDYNLYLLSCIRERGMLVFNGRDEQLAAGLLMGATGGIGTFYNIFPALFVAIFDYASAGKWAEAAALQLQINPILEKLFSAPLVPATRKVMALCGFPNGVCIAPRRPLASAEETMIEQTVATMPAELKAYVIKP